MQKFLPILEYKNNKKIISKWENILNSNKDRKTLLKEIISILPLPDTINNPHIKHKTAGDSLEIRKGFVQNSIKLCDEYNYKKNYCKTQVYKNEIDTLKILILTCKTTQCINTINNHIMKYQIKINQLIQSTNDKTV